MKGKLFRFEYVCSQEENRRVTANSSFFLDRLWSDVFFPEEPQNPQKKIRFFLKWLSSNL